MFHPINDFLKRKELIYLQFYGGLAQLARAPHWQCGGQRFDSAILHLIMNPIALAMGFFISKRIELVQNSFEIKKLN